MNRDHARHPRRCRFSPERLEDRAVPAAYGIPWADPGHLSISFASDGTAIAGHMSTLSASLDSQMPRGVWQRQILKAFQTWAVNAGVNIALTTDGGQAFGVAGQTQHDARFGDIRIGAQQMSPDALSISVPSDPSFTGTWSGDVLVNSTDLFDAAHLDLYAVMLHEAGHVFGLDHSADPKSPMFSHFNRTTTLTSADIKALQALYGLRAADSHEGSSGNDTIGRATQLQASGGSSGKTPTVAFGDISTSRDVDFYAFKPQISNYSGGVTIRLQTAGISLMSPHLTVLDDKGNVVGEAQAASGFGDVVTVHLAAATPGATYFLKVQGATQDVFGIGHYGLAVSLDSASTTTPAAIDKLLRGDYQSLSPSELDSILRDPTHTLLNDDHHSDDALISATTLIPASGFVGVHYGTVGSISDVTDVDYYRIKGPNGGNSKANVLTVKVRAIAPNGAAPKVALFDSDMNPIPAQVLANGNGLFTVQAIGVKSGGNVIVRVSGAGNPSLVGNYGLDADYGTRAASPQSFTAGSVTAAAPVRSGNLYVARAQLFQFLFSAGAPGAAAGVGVRMTIRNASGRSVFSLFAPAGDVVSGPSVLLTPGAYTITFSAVTPPGVAFTSMSFLLRGDSISDPIGPTLADPTLKPVYTTPSKPGYTYPGGIVTTKPYWLGTVF